MTADSSFYRTKYDSNVIPKIIERLCFFYPVNINFARYRYEFYVLSMARL